ncbi:hypothetical protein [Salibacterium aidingense]|uniref:hypothetical protein n=1 Tax=Salibacterium aidingense TaxID=384933 RepID=UPI000429370E|nr:hypothetical protein [Salibacterium aidingense]
MNEEDFQSIRTVIPDPFYIYREAGVLHMYFQGVTVVIRNSPIRGTLLISLARSSLWFDMAEYLESDKLQEMSMLLDEYICIAKDKGFIGVEVEFVHNKPMTTDPYEIVKVLHQKEFFNVMGSPTEQSDDLSGNYVHYFK